MSKKEQLEQKHTEKTLEYKWCIRQMMLKDGTIEPETERDFEFLESVE